MEILSRNEAKLKNVKKYFTGHFCRREHLSFRYTNSGACVDCIALYGQMKRERKMQNAIKTTTLQVAIHRDDVAAVKRFVASLKLARRMQKEAE